MSAVAQSESRTIATRKRTMGRPGNRSNHTSVPGMLTHLVCSYFATIYAQATASARVMTMPIGRGVYHPSNLAGSSRIVTRSLRV